MATWERAEAAIVGIGETKYYRHGNSPDPEMKMCLEAIIRAADDAGIDVRELDGFATYDGETNEAPRIAAALGLPGFTFSSMVWGGGGGGVCGAVAHAAAAVALGHAKHVVVYRALAQGQFGRYGHGPDLPSISGRFAFMFPYGVLSPAQMFALRTRRFMYEHDVGQGALKAVALASYHHAQRNPRAVMYGRPLTPEKYDESRWIVEPFHLYDCCQENDSAAAVIVTSTDRAIDLEQDPAFIRAATQGSGFRQGEGISDWGAPEYGTSNFGLTAARLYEMAGVGPKDINVMQSYENMTGGVVMSIVEHGFCKAEEANDFLTVENLTVPGGKLPLNTSGGNLAECYMHGLGLVIEAVRQVRGTSTSQVPEVEFSLVTGGPMTAPVSNLLLSSELR